MLIIINLHYAYQLYSVTSLLKSKYKCNESYSN